jgi:hypothetical protein
MSLTGSVRNGVVVLDNGYQLAEGTVVEVVVREAVSTNPLEQKKPTLQALLKYAGTVKNLPPDFAAQHDHYIHGTPKR